MSTPSSQSQAESGLLLVFAEPGKNVTLEEFHDWYDNEHIPLRTEKFHEFRSAARYHVPSSVASASRPYTSSTWSAIYTISSLSLLLSDPAYTSLRTNRSEREAELLGRIGILDRRIYKLTYDSDVDPKFHSTAAERDGGDKSKDDDHHHRWSTRPTKASEISPVVIATSVTPAEGNQEAYDEWYLDEHVEALSKVPGWIRTRRFELVDALIVGNDAAPENADAKSVPRCLGLHENASPEFSSTPEFAAALDTPWRTRIMREDGSGIVQQERRVMQLYRAWDPTVALQHPQSG
ncbi:unnamed protein product [Tilletia controversa]|uniref:EthD domain-containing protein n=3 Tax=Tilletia TaxID=13289 RepID=A0A8X7MRJ5_9BASI|nr:hypothetical protein CF336_g7478 [Tilletia laevis]KAE8187894.1 hypothetical protein CF328_g6776 [Tilletia controversa]KAE8247344.1 hypothetical protein A4X03_0g7069 [Tilletia caries]KAE8187565.1 hypothetical protein CF335_g7135 [Tilletia laevis]KAE8245392.1 hypothetical protein A4X06_0g5704 [Tilletia controversa]